VYLLIAFLDQVEQTERAIRRLREFGIPEPLVVRARSAAAALSAEVPVFAGLRSLALGADEDRLLLVSLLPPSPTEELERLVQRVQLEMDADDPPMGRLVALPVIAAPTYRRP
jgi:HAMP domain-containing protein